MSRPRRDDRRQAILAAATRVIAAQGLTAASTAAIAKEAQVSNGSLFNYFETKAALLNELYGQLKSEMAAAAGAGALADSEPARDQLQRAWAGWIRWATAAPEKRRTLAQLGVSDDITPESRELGRASMRPFAELLERARAGGPTAGVPLAFVVVLVSAIADSTVDALIEEPGAARELTTAGFEAACRVLAGTSSGDRNLAHGQRS